MVTAQYAEGCMDRLVHATVERPSARLSVHRSTAAAKCGRFAAERHAGRRYRSIAAGAPALTANAGG